MSKISPVLAVLICSLVASIAHAQTTWGPYIATGNGVTQPIACANADIQMEAQVSAIEQALPPGHIVLAVNKSNMSWDGWTCSYTYYVTTGPGLTCQSP